MSSRVNLSFVLTLLFILLLCTCGRAQESCANDECGDLPVTFQATINAVGFCEGTSIAFQNNSEQGYDFFIIDWQDGDIDTVRNYNNVSHEYNFPVPEEGQCNENTTFLVFFTGYASCQAGQSCQTITKSFVIRPKPIARIEVSSEVCAGRELQFESESCSAESFEWDFGDGSTSTDEDPIHIYQAAGTYDVRLVVSGTSSCMDITDVTTSQVTIVTPPNALFTVDDEDLIACKDETITFTNDSNEDTNIEWMIAPATGWEFIDTNMTVRSEIISVIFNNVREYTVTLTGRNACDEETLEREIQILEAPTVRILNDLTDCDVVSVSPSALGYNVSGEFTEICWEFPDGNAPNVCAETFGPVNFTSSGMVRLIVTSLCGDITREAMINVQSSAPPTLTAGDNYCTGSSPDTLTASSPGGEWGGPGIIDRDLGIFDPSVAGPGTHILTYEITSGACQNMNTISVMVEASTMVSTPDDEFCLDGGVVSLTANPPGGTWTGTGITDPSGTFNPDSAGVGPASPVYTFVDVNMCRVEVSPTITIEPIPVITRPDSVLVCNEDESVDLESLTGVSSSVAGGTYSWTLNGDPVANGTFNPFTDLPGPGDYTLGYNYENIPCTVAGELTLSVVQKPALTLTPQPTLCVNGAPITLESNLPGGTWSGTGITDGDAGTFDPQLAGINLHTISYDITEGTCRNAGMLQLEVVEGAVVTTLNAEFCLDSEAANLSALPTGGTWSGTGIIDPVAGTFDPDSAGVGTANPVYTFNDNDGCVITASPNVEVFPIPEVSGTDTALACLVNEAVELVGITGVPSNLTGTYSWTVNETELPGSTFNPENDLPGAGIYPVSFVYESGPCSVPGALFLRIINNPQLVLTPQDNVCISQGELLLEANLSSGSWLGESIDPVTGIIDLVAAGGGTFTYTYTFQPGGSCAQTEQQNITIEDPGATIMVGGNQAHCEDSELTATLTGGTPTGGSWSGDGVTDATTGTVDLTQLVPGQTYEYIYGIESTTTPGCSAEARKELAYNPAPNPNFTLNGSPCINESFSLSALQTGGDFNYTWTFGDGAESNSPSPTHTYTTGGTFTQTLRVTSVPEGCSADTTTTVYVTTPPAPSFTLDSTLGCAAFVLNLNDESTGDDFTSYWLVDVDTFPGGGIQNVILDGYLEDTEVSVALVAENFCGARTQVQSVVVKPYPTVDFGLDVDDGCSLFQPELSNVTLGNPDSFLWDMGEGTTGNDSIPPVVRYFTPEDSVSVYSITLIATNECGKDTLVRNVTVHPPDVRAFIGLDTISGCQPWRFEPRSFSTPGASLAWEILAPDGTITASGNQPNPSFELAQVGVHRVLLSAARCGEDTDTVFVNVLPAPEVSFLADPAVCLGDQLVLSNTSSGIAGGFYTLGNGNTLNQINGVVTYPDSGDYTLSFTGYSALNNCPATISQPVNVRALPAVTIAASDSSGCTALSVTFSNVATSGNALNYAWDFDDATATSNESAPTHTYSTPGTYFPRLTVTDNNGCANDTFLSRIIVHPDPVPEFAITTSRFCSDYDSLRLTESSAGAIALAWMVNGETFPGTPTVLPLLEPGLETVVLTATSIHGCAASTEQTYEVLPSPKAEVSVLADTVCLNTAQVFSSGATAATDIFWNLMDGTGSTEPDFRYTYGSPGDYAVTLIAANDNGCPSDTATTPVRVNVLPVAGFSLSESVRCGTPAPVVFMNNSSGGLSYRWIFGNGATATDPNPEYTYLTAGSYSPMLTVENEFGCQDTSSQELIISGAPAAEFVRPPSLACSPYPLQLAAEPTEALRYEWYLDDAFTPVTGELFDTLLTENRPHRVRLIAIYDALCRDTLTVENLIDLRPRPVAGFTAQEDELPNRLGEVTFQSTSTGGDDYFWDLGDGTVRTIPSFYHEYRVNRDITVTHAITQRYEQGLICSDTIRRNIEPEWLTSFFVPNAVSPQSGPDEVRVWGAKGFGVAEYELQVYSSYGQLLFSTNELRDSQPVGRWDARLSTTGEFVLQGAYTWRASVTFVDGNTRNLVGSVTVVR
jgi:PKD repeat protein